MRRLFWLGIAALGLSAGVYELRQSMFAEPLRISCAEFARARPEQTWLQLTDCRLDTASAVLGLSKLGGWAGKVATAAKKNKGHVDALFIPALASDAPVGAAVPLLIASRDPQLISLLRKLDAAWAGAPELPELVDQLRKRLSLLESQRVFEGFVRPDELTPPPELREFLGDRLALDAPVLALGSRPDSTTGLVSLAIGLGAAVLGLGLHRLRRRAPLPAGLEGADPQLGELEAARREYDEEQKRAQQG